VVRLIAKIQRKMGLWVVGQFILSVFIFILTYIGLTILGVEYALVLALIAGLLEVVPYIGPFVSAMPAIFFALIQSPPLVIGVIILYILIQKTEGYVLVPKIMEKTVGTSPLVVLLALLIGFKLAGILGVLLAVPLTGAITVIIQEFFQNKSQPTVL
jgi:predicted PurR-regulated permease PerM